MTEKMTVSPAWALAATTLFADRLLTSVDRLPGMKITCCTPHPPLSPRHVTHTDDGRLAAFCTSVAGIDRAAARVWQSHRRTSRDRALSGSLFRLFCT